MIWVMLGLRLLELIPNHFVFENLEQPLGNLQTETKRTEQSQGSVRHPFYNTGHGANISVVGLLQDLGGEPFIVQHFDPQNNTVFFVLHWATRIEADTPSDISGYVPLLY